MFWNKRKYYDEDFGELIFECDSWQCKVVINEDDSFIDIEGSKEAPDLIALEQAKKLFTIIGSSIETAIEFIGTKDISQFSSGMGKFVFDGFRSSKDSGKYDLEFGLTDWPDAMIVVHFNQGVPYEISLND